MKTSKETAKKIERVINTIRSKGVSKKVISIVCAQNNVNHEFIRTIAGWSKKIE